MQTTVKAYAKINWALDILSRREDGYHRMDMLMQNIDLCDEISFSPARFVTLEMNGRLVTGGSKNLIVRAATALNEYMGETRGVKVQLKKRIPVRAGLGGGSADCAATLLALNEIWRLRLPFKTLLTIGESLGADVPYCLMGGLCRVSGIGEVLTPMDGAKEYPMLLTLVGEGLSTQAVFAEFDEHVAVPEQVDLTKLHELLSEGKLEEACAVSGNALEKAALRLMPEIAGTMQKMRDLGAKYVRMSGSGSAVYGVFDSEEAAKNARERFPEALLTHTLVTRGNCDMDM